MLQNAKYGSFYQKARAHLPLKKGGPRGLYMLSQPLKYNPCRRHRDRVKTIIYHGKTRPLALICTPLPSRIRGTGSFLRGNNFCLLSFYCPLQLRIRRLDNLQREHRHPSSFLASLRRHQDVIRPDHSFHQYHCLSHITRSVHLRLF